MLHANKALHALKDRITVNAVTMAKSMRAFIELLVLSNPRLEDVHLAFPFTGQQPFFEIKKPQ